MGARLASEVASGAAAKAGAEAAAPSGAAATSPEAASEDSAEGEAGWLSGAASEATAAEGDADGALGEAAGLDGLADSGAESSAGDSSVAGAASSAGEGSSSIEAGEDAPTSDAPEAGLSCATAKDGGSMRHADIMIASSVRGIPFFILVSFPLERPRDGSAGAGALLGAFHPRGERSRTRARIFQGHRMNQAFQGRSHSVPFRSASKDDQTAEKQRNHAQWNSGGWLNR